MMTLECQHCGAKLALEGPKVPAEVRCKRCGRRSSTAGAVNAQAPKPRTDAEPPTAGVSSPQIPPPPTSYPPSDVRVPPEEVYPRPQPRPGFYGGDSTLPSGSGKAVALIGVVAGVLLAFGVAVWFVAAPKEQQTPYVGPPAMSPGNSAEHSRNAEASNSPGPGRSTSETSTSATRGSTATQSPKEPTRLPPPTPSHASTTLSIQASGDGLNDKIYVSSELALGEYERNGLARLSDDKLDRAFRDIFDAAELAEPKALEEFREWFTIAQTAVDQAERIRGHMWHVDNRPTFLLPLSGVPESGVDVEVSIRCRDKTSRALIVGGAATSPSPISAKPNSDGDCLIPLILRLEASTALSLVTPQTVHLTIDVRFKRNSQEVGRQEIPHSVTVYPASFVESLYPNGYSFATVVDEDHRWVKELIEKVNSGPFCTRMGITLGGSEVDLRGVFALWRELSARGIRYSSIANTSSPEAQEVRSFHDSLVTKNANCADGTAMLCSLLTKAGAKPSMVLVYGHAFVGLPLLAPLWFEGDWDSKKAKFSSGTWKLLSKPLLPMGLETTMLGNRKPCSEAFRRLLLDCSSQLKAFDAAMASADRDEWRAFLGAIEVGTRQIQEEYIKVMRGQGEYPNLPTTCGTILKSMKGELLDEKGSPLSDEAAISVTRECLRSLAQRFMRVLDIEQARREGVRPTGSNESLLPQEGIGTLRSK